MCPLRHSPNPGVVRGPQHTHLQRKIILQVLKETSDLCGNLYFSDVTQIFIT